MAAAHAAGQADESPRGRPARVPMRSVEADIASIDDGDSAIPGQYICQWGPLRAGTIVGATTSAPVRWRIDGVDDRQSTVDPRHWLGFDGTTGQCLADPREKPPLSPRAGQDGTTGQCLADPRIATRRDPAAVDGGAARVMPLPDASDRARPSVVAVEGGATGVML